MLTLVLGGARSGKSRYAQSLCAADDTVVIATAINVDDDELAARVARHQADRPATWTTIEEPYDLVGAIRPAATRPVIIDCVTVWLSNLMWKYRALPDDRQQEELLARTAALADAAHDRDVVAVSNEVGDGVVPAHPTARRFRDLQGLANQILAREATRVVRVVAGLPLVLKDSAGRREEVCFRPSTVSLSANKVFSEAGSGIAALNQRRVRLAAITDGSNQDVANLAQVLATLRAEEQDLESQLAKIRGALTALTAHDPRRPGGGRIKGQAGARKKRTMTAAQREAVSERMKKFWAKRKAVQE